MEDFKTRLLDERTDLNQKIDKLGPFINSEKYSELPVKVQDLLRVQLYAMKTYSYVLTERMILLGLEVNH
jgi:hypothetical protein